MSELHRRRTDAVDDRREVDDYETEITIDPDDGQFLTATATGALSTYRCAPHTAMNGAIEVVDEL